MSKWSNYWFLVLGAVAISRLAAMAVLPFVDTTEARYGEIARLMAETGDWITPWFEPGVPFWGKPPLSFWAQAAAIKALGLSEFSLRLPSLLVTGAMALLVWHLAREYRGVNTARWAVVIFASMALPYVSAGAVMTDAYFALGTTLSLAGFYLAIQKAGSIWGWLFFLGLAIGLLAKGPLAVVLVAIPITLWILFGLCRLRELAILPWRAGTLLTLVLVLPWYLWAEIKTPGFLHYFLLGEHILRFIDPGWSGDLYGNAHLQPKGMIWVFWLWASFPWGILSILLRVSAGSKSGNLFDREFWRDKKLVFVLACALGPLLFFSLASNLLWTYVLPSLPFSAVLIAAQITRYSRSPCGRRLRNSLALVSPLLLLSVTLAYGLGDYRLKSEKSLVGHYNQRSDAGHSLLLYLGDLPFSARFYSRGTAQSVTYAQLTAMLKSGSYDEYFIAIPRGRLSDERSAMLADTGIREFKNRRYELISIDRSTPDSESLSSAE
ncbi:ArnT family glycosyltransferase [Microbulbifer sp. TYP-18]|uniref:ArnT family glycosyltransferase n=1 Tax=Microbulbifer sp. TYP-18 TaxID=3230024 RepID=UPI0034C69E33